MRVLWVGTCPAFVLCATMFATSVAAQSPPPVIYACVNIVLVRIVTTPTACRPSETLISWNQQGVPGPQGPPGAGGASGSTSNNADGVIVFPDADNALLIPVFAGSFGYQTPSPQLQYTSTDCTGPEYMLINRGATRPIINRLNFVQDGADIVYPDTAAAPQPIVPGSVKTITWTSTFPSGTWAATATCGPNPFPGFAFTLTPAKHWTIPPYQTPFRVQ